jgi:hypothetical protein
VSEQTPSPFTCAFCGKVAMWSKLLESGEFVAMEQPPSDMKAHMLAFGNEQYWWLEIPCQCGSRQFSVKADPKKFVGSYGTNV